MFKLISKIKDKIKRFWKWLTVALVGGVVIAQVVGFPPSEIVVPDHLKLKVPIVDLLGSKEFTHLDRDKDMKRIKGTEKRAVKYAYKANLLSDRSSEVVSKRNKWSRTFDFDKKDEKGNKQFVTEIIPGVPQYYQDTDGSWWQANYATTSFDAFNQQVSQSPLRQKIAYWLVKVAQAACTSPCTFYPDPNVETDTVDGTAWYDATEKTWADIQDDDGSEAGHAAQDSSATDNMILLHTGASTWTAMYRSGFLFNAGGVNGIPSGSTIDSAIFSVLKNSTSTEFSGDNIKATIVSFAPATNTAVVTGDFNDLGTTALSSAVDWEAPSDGAYIDWTLNADGRAVISTAIAGDGIVKYGLRPETDRTNTETWQGPNFGGGFAGKYAETADTTSDPKLVITWSAGGGGGGRARRMIIQ